MSLTCPPHELLERLGGSELSAASAASLRDHLQVCEHCRRAFDTHAGGTASECPTALIRVGLSHSAIGDLARPAIDGTLRVVGYEILGQLGRGGMGVVYRVRDLRLNRIVAIKMIDVGRDDSAVLDRFRVEAEAVARLQHPNVVQIYEVGVADGRPYYALELVEGGDLLRFAAARPIKARDAAELVRQSAGGIAAAHRSGVIHRDLKPHNILLTPNGTPKVTDFGLAKLSDSSSATRTGDIMGTPSYMAPEQARGRSHQVTPATDVYGLGGVLYYLLTGRPPFDHHDAVELLNDVCTRDPVAPSRFNPAVPRDLETVCLKCLRKEPADRYPDADALADDLARFLDGRPIAARPLGLAGRVVRAARRNPAVAALLAALACVIVVSMFAVTREWRAAVRLAADEKLARLELERGRALAALDLGLARSSAGAIDAGREEFLRAGELARSLGDAALERAADRNLRAFDDLRVRPVAQLQHTDWVWSVAHSPDGRLVATGSRDGTVGVWDAATARVAVLPHPDFVTSVAFTPDGRWLLTGCGGEKIAHGEARVWEMATGAVVGLARLDTPVSHVEPSRDGSRFLAVAEEEARLYDLKCVPIGTGTGKLGRVAAARLHPDGRHVLVGLDVAVAVFDAETGTEQGRARVPGGVKAVDFSPDGSLFAAGGSGGLLRVWETASVDPVTAALPHPGSIRVVAFHPGGRMVAAGCSSPMTPGGRVSRGEVRLWDIERSMVLNVPWDHPGAVWSLRFTPDGRLAVAGCVAGPTRVWSVADGRPVGNVLDHEGTAVAVSISPDGTSAAVASAGGGNHARLWSLPRGRVEAVATSLKDGVHVLKRSPDGLGLAARCHAGGDSIVELPSGREVWHRHTPGLNAGDVEFGADGTLHMGGPGGYLRAGRDERGVWGDPVLVDPRHSYWVREADGGLLRGHVDGSLWWASSDGSVRHAWRAFERGGLNGVMPTPDRKAVLVYTFEEVAIWDMGGEPRRRWKMEPASKLVSAAVAPDGERVAVGCEDGFVRFYSTADGRPVGQPLACEGRPHMLAFAPCGTLAVGSEQGELRFWDTELSRPLGPVCRHTSGVKVAVFVDDGRRLVTGTADGFLRIWATP